MKRILNLALAIALLLTLAPGLGVSAEPSGDGDEPAHATGLIWDSWETIEAHLREDPPSAFESGLPPSVDLSDEFPAPGDQGQQKSCVAWAVAYALRSHQEEVNQNWGLHTDEHLFSPGYVHNQINHGVNGGASISAAMGIIAEQGVSTLASFPYDEFDYLTWPTAEQRAEAAHFKSGNYYTISGIDSIKKRLADGDGVVIGIDIYPDFDNLQPSNPIFDLVNGASRGAHAVCLIGYDDDLNAFKFINSWGTGWGLDGHGWISYDLMNDIRVNNFGAAVGFVMDAYDASTIERFYEYTVSDIGEATITRYVGFGGDIVIPDTLDGYPVTAIGYSVFSNNKSLTSVVIPDGVRTIGSYAFYDCTSLTNVVIPSSVTSIGGGAFSAFLSPHPPNLTIHCYKNSYAHNYAVINRIPLVLLDCDEPLIYHYTLSNDEATIIRYDGIGGDIVIPDTLDGYPVTAIDEMAFLSCASLTGVVIPDGVRTIGEMAFFDCTSLTNVIIPDSVSVIDESAFHYLGYQWPFSPLPNLIIHCCENSYAHDYAIENEIPFLIKSNQEIKKIIPNTVGGEVTVNLACPLEDGEALIIAVYDSIDGKLLGIGSKADGSNTVGVDNLSNNVLIKAFLWDSLDTMQPLCPAMTVKYENNEWIAVD